MRLASQKKLFKIVVLGEKDSGKTALTVRYLTGKFIYDYATGEDLIYPHHVHLNNNEVQLSIVDTSQNTVSSSIVDADGIVIVYAINSTKSFRRAKELLAHVVAVSGSLPCIAIAANKADMWHYRTVMRSDGEYLAKKYGCKYFELSALTDSESVHRMFDVVVKLMNDSLVNKEIMACKSVILINDSSPPKEDFEGRRRARSLHLPTQKESKQKQTNQKSPILFRKLIRSWNQSSLSRSKSTEKLF